MCTATRTSTAFVVLVAAFLMSCGSPARTGTNFCRQLQNELPGIAAPIETLGDANAMVNRYKRLSKVAPLTIQKDFEALTRVLSMAASANPNNTDELQAVADAAYSANAAARNVVAWVKDTCAVDIKTGVSVTPPRKPVPTTSTVATTSTIATTTTPAP